MRMSSATTRLASSSRSVPLAERIRATVGKSRIEIRRQVNCSLVLSLAPRLSSLMFLPPLSPSLSSLLPHYPRSASVASVVPLSSSLFISLCPCRCQTLILEASVLCSGASRSHFAVFRGPPLSLCCVQGPDRLCCVQGPDRLQPTVPKKCFSMEERNMQGNLFMASPKGRATFVTSRPSSSFIGSPSAPSSPSKPQKPRPVTAGDATHLFHSTIEC